jgi:hypothetical protein
MCTENHVYTCTYGNTMVPWVLEYGNMPYPV